MNIQEIFNAVVAFNENNNYIDVVVITLVILGGYAAKKYWVTETGKPSDAIKTLAVGTVFTIVYTLLTHLQGHAVNMVKCFVSYAVATSMYEIIIKEVTKVITKFTGNDKATEQPNP